MRKQFPRLSERKFLAATLIRHKKDLSRDCANEQVEVEGDPKTRRSRRSLLLPRVCVDQLERHREQQEIEHREYPPGTTAASSGRRKREQR